MDALFGARDDDGSSMGKLLRGCSPRAAPQASSPAGGNLAPGSKLPGKVAAAQDDDDDFLNQFSIDMLDDDVPMAPPAATTRPAAEAAAEDKLDGPPPGAPAASSTLPAETGPCHTAAAANPMTGNSAAADMEAPQPLGSPSASAPLPAMQLDNLRREATPLPGQAVRPSSAERAPADAPVDNAKLQAGNITAAGATDIPAPSLLPASPAAATAAAPEQQRSPVVQPATAAHATSSSVPQLGSTATDPQEQQQQQAQDEQQVRGVAAMAGMDEVQQTEPPPGDPLHSVASATGSALQGMEVMTAAANPIAQAQEGEATTSMKGDHATAATQPAASAPLSAPAAEPAPAARAVHHSAVGSIAPTATAAAPAAAAGGAAGKPQTQASYFQSSMFQPKPLQTSGKLHLPSAAAPGAPSSSKRPFTALAPAAATHQSTLGAPAAATAAAGTRGVAKAAAPGSAQTKPTFAAVPAFKLGPGPFSAGMSTSKPSKAPTATAPGAAAAAASPAYAGSTAAGGGASGAQGAASRKVSLQDSDAAIQSSSSKRRAQASWPAAPAPAAPSTATAAPFVTPGKLQLAKAAEAVAAADTLERTPLASSNSSSAGLQDHLMSVGKPTPGSAAPAAAGRAGDGYGTGTGAAAAEAGAEGDPMQVDEEGGHMVGEQQGAADAGGTRAEEEEDVLEATLASGFSTHIKRLEAMLLEAASMQEQVLQLRVRTAINSNRLVRLNNPSTANKLAVLHKALAG